MRWKFLPLTLTGLVAFAAIPIASAAAGQGTNGSGACRAPSAQARADGLVARQEALLTNVANANLVIDTLSKAADSARLAQATELVAIYEGTLGNAYAKIRAFDKAEQTLQHGIEVAHNLQLCSLAAISGISLGNAYFARARISEAGALRAEANNYYGKAYEAYTEAETDAKRSDAGDLAELAVINKARVMVRSGISDAFIAVLSTVVDSEGPQTTSRTRLLNLVTVGRLLTQATAYALRDSVSDRARELAKRAFSLAASRAQGAHDIRAESLALGYLGELLELEDDVANAETMTGRALFAAQTIQAADLLYRWNWQLGRLLAYREDLIGAEAAFRRAVREVESIRGDIPVDYVNGTSSFLETTGELYRQFADVLLRNADRYPGNARKLRIDAQATLEMMKISELYNYFQDLCFDPTRIRNIADVNDRTAVLYPVLLPGRLEVLVFFPQGAEDPAAFVTEVDQERVVATARALRLLLQARNDDYVAPASELYRWIFSDALLATLEKNNIDTLVWIPDGALRDIPLAALTPNGTDFVIDRFALATAPGLTLVDPRPVGVLSDRAMLLAGVSIQVPGSDFPALPNVLNEIRDINAVRPGTVLVNEKFGVSTLQQELRATPYGIVHITAHAKFDFDRSYILTSEGPLTMNGLEDAVKQSGQGDGSLELIVLEGCETAAGDDRAALGLAGIAIKAGARSAVATLWPIYENPTSKLVVEFYSGISDAKGLSKAQALRAAQRLLKSDPNFRHPYYWSPYLLIGNWL